LAGFANSFPAVDAAYQLVLHMNFFAGLVGHIFKRQSALGTVSLIRTKVVHTLDRFDQIAVLATVPWRSGLATT
jgi:hypothetical protein